MNVFVTGGSGDVGRATVRRLLESGHRVTVAGRRPLDSIEQGAVPEGAAYAQLDIGDVERLASAMAGHDAVVHLAAIRDPTGVAGHRLFRTNTGGTFGVFEVAANCGIRRVVSASSINAVGYFFGDRSFPLSYIPIDESHRTLQTDAYSFSKFIGEQIADYFWERDGVSSISIRIPQTMSHQKVLEEDFAGWGGGIVEELLAAPDGERRERIARMQRAYDAYRRGNRLDQVPPGTRVPFVADDLTNGELIFMLRQVNFFAYLDDLDCAQAIELGLTAGFEGSHTLFVNSAQNALGLPLEKVALLYEPVPTLRQRHAVPLGSEPDSCVPSIERARELLGFSPVW